MIPLTLTVWIVCSVYQHSMAASKTEQLKKYLDALFLEILDIINNN